jgi:hypothetical protein
MYIGIIPLKNPINHDYNTKWLQTNIERPRGGKLHTNIERSPEPMINNIKSMLGGLNGITTMYIGIISFKIPIKHH